jgi:2'-5' RNA ligase
VAFLGYVDDERLPECCSAIAKASATVEPFEVVLDHVMLAPRADEPRILWLRGEWDKNLDSLRERVEKAVGVYSRDRKSSVPHITLGRIRAVKWKDLGEAPGIDERVRIPVYAGALTLFESTTENGKRVYIPLQQCAIGSDDMKTEQDDADIRGDNR